MARQSRLHEATKRAFENALDTPGKRIRFLREAREMTQQTLASKCYTSQAAVSQWENDVWLPNIPRQILIAEALGSTRAFLFGVEVAA